MKHTIDAQDKKMGRVASEAAKILMGKNKTDFARNTTTDDTVEVINASKLDISEKKLAAPAFKYFSGFAGGLREEALGNAITKKGMPEVLRKVVLGMLPKNKLRSRIIKQLKVTE